MRRRSRREYLVCSAALILACASCIKDTCPEGTTMSGSNCVADPDTAPPDQGATENSAEVAPTNNVPTTPPAAGTGASEVAGAGGGSQQPESGNAGVPEVAGAGGAPAQ